MIDLFQKIDFKSHSGLDLSWKIEMDALSDNEWKCIAHMIMGLSQPFQAVIGIPRGGLKLGGYLHEYSTQNPADPYLIVDDVMTTGGSMEEYLLDALTKEETFSERVETRKQLKSVREAIRGHIKEEHKNSIG